METILNQLNEIKYQLGILRARNAFPVIDNAIANGYVRKDQRDAILSMAVENPDQFEKFIGVCKPADGGLTPNETTICANLDITNHEKFIAAKVKRAANG